MNEKGKFFIFVIFSILFVLLILLKEPIHRSIHIFYYPWYGNPQFNGEYRHWNHKILGNDESYFGADDIGANFYPLMGCYRSYDPKIINLHMKQIKDAGIDVVTVSWLGEGSYEDGILMTLLDIAENNGLTINLHIEPFYHTIKEIYTSLVYLESTYGYKQVIYKLNNMPFLYIYDSYKMET